MRLTLTHDDGEVLGNWSLPNELSPAEIELSLADGLHRNHGLDRCDRCGGFFPKASMVEISDDSGPTVACQPCTNLPY